MRPNRLIALVQEVGSWRAAASREQARQWEQLHHAGRCEEAETARQWAEALDEAQRALRRYA